MSEDVLLEERNPRLVRHPPFIEQPFVNRSTDDLNIVADISLEENCVQCQNVPLKYGENVYHLTVQVCKRSVNIWLTFEQLFISFKTM